ncbi:transcriptional regulator, TetR family [Gottschalkia acidurici 9a]|uniref:Transcriptional regulator, TetR family n=1 Tax=Gottschalkia acidurici (strain ATCC 7906 / DSM 604 / BCRC 14475 / CIP 104303 / KCTC 5404 / NCIMB 10678 / 9a) TaxID=1128398 RepID=K0B4A8_GOTA9|nr:TetR/AcrR family transcriptional regulator [Gottschalkia acidurici]AFS79770.1 transcriptional regulator, TetR family [Gottschalkia acidurici 9a]
MTKATYHHGDLKKSLILKGLKLLNEKGIEEFSLRKVAAMCNVSHTAPYKHFKNKEELVTAIGNHVNKEFEESLKETVKFYSNDPQKQIIELGKKYVKFMVDNPDYLKFLFLGENQYPINIKNNKFEYHDASTFEIFKNSAINLLHNMAVDESEYTKNIIAMWAMVHGISILLSNGTLSYDGEISELVEMLIVEKLKL